MTSKIRSGSGNPRNFRDSYVLGKVLGEGHCSTVRKCRHKFSKSFYAAKLISLDCEKEEANERREMVRNEVKVLRLLKHDNIVKFVDVFYSTERIIMISELGENGDLHDFIVNQEQVSENVARAVSLEVAAAINYIHSQNIAHRDIKPENFLIWNKREKDFFSVKLCDFGLAEEVPMYGLSRICGSPSFVAPEILQCQTYGLSVDVWSLGVVFYFLLCRFCPYERENLQEKFEMIITNELKFPAPHWEDVSSEAKSLIKRILVTNPKRRIKANTVLRDRWFQKKPQKKQSGLHSKNVSFKSVALAVTATTGMLRSRVPLREKADVSSELLQKVFAQTTPS